MVLDDENYSYVAYIDESGDDGLRKVRPFDKNGSSEWFVLSALLFRAENDHVPLNVAKSIVKEFRNHQKPDIHFSDLNPAKKLVACDILGNTSSRAFVVASNKKNMQGYRNKKAENVPSRNWFYCWVTRLLLERLSHFVAKDSMERYGEYRKVKLVYSQRGGFSYSQLTAYYRWLKSRPLVLNQGPIYWECLDPELQEVRNHKSAAGLQLVDIVASSFFKAIDTCHTNGLDNQYAKALRKIMAKSDGVISGYGLKLMPNIQKANLTVEQEEIFRFYGYPKSWWAPDSADSQAISSASKGQASW
jgi:hypothetical protein